MNLEEETKILGFVIWAPLAAIGLYLAFPLVDALVNRLGNDWACLAPFIWIFLGAYIFPLAAIFLTALAQQFLEDRFKNDDDGPGSPPSQY